MDDHSYNLKDWFDFPTMIIFVILLYPHFLAYKTCLFFLSGIFLVVELRTVKKVNIDKDSSLPETSFEQGKCIIAVISRIMRGVASRIPGGL